MDDQKLAEAKASLGAGMAFPIGEPNPFGQYFGGFGSLCDKGLA